LPPLLELDPWLTLDARLLPVPPPELPVRVPLPLLKPELFLDPPLEVRLPLLELELRVEPPLEPRLLPELELRLPCELELWLPPELELCEG